MTSINQHKPFLIFLAKFIGFFLLFYYGTELVIGLSAPGGMYSPFVEKYLDYVTWISNALIKGSQVFVGMLGYDTYTADNFVVRIVDGRGVRVAYGCVGYGVMSFWLAFLIAVKESWKTKLIWLAIGWAMLYVINVMRIGLYLLAVNKGWPMPFGIDHHTWFNIVAYGCIFLMMYFFDKKTK